MLLLLIACCLRSLFWPVFLLSLPQIFYYSGSTFILFVDSLGRMIYTQLSVYKPRPDKI